MLQANLLFSGVHLPVVPRSDSAQYWGNNSGGHGRVHHPQQQDSGPILHHQRYNSVGLHFLAQQWCLFRQLRHHIIPLWKRNRMCETHGELFFNSSGLLFV